jgi:hypothetical protein
MHSFLSEMHVFWISVSLTSGSHKTPDIARLNPFNTRIFIAILVGY